jgi:hypothetical protein
MEKLIYADELRSGDRFRYQDQPVMTCDGGIRSETAECDGCKCQTIKKLRINVPGGAMTIVNEPKAVVVLLHRPWPEGKTEREMLDRVAEFARAAAEAVDRSHHRPVDPSGSIEALRRASEDYQMGKARTL